MSDVTPKSQLQPRRKEDVRVKLDIALGHGHRIERVIRFVSASKHAHHIAVELRRVVSNVLKIPPARGIDRDLEQIADAWPPHGGEILSCARANVDAELMRALHAAIDDLPPLQRTILTLYYLDEVPLADIARITGIAGGTIKSHLFRSRAKLREKLTALVRA
jgi:RNA polymerase sigma factor (sigma-70 family)